MHASGYDFASFSEFESCTCLCVAEKCLKFALRVWSAEVEAQLASTLRGYQDCKDFSVAGQDFLPAEFWFFLELDSDDFGESNKVIEHGLKMSLGFEQCYMPFMPFHMKIAFYIVEGCKFWLQQ